MFLFTFQPLAIVLQAQEGSEAKEHSCLFQFLLGAVEEVGLQMGSPGGMTPSGLCHCQLQPAEGVEGPPLQEKAGLGGQVFQERLRAEGI